jgi:hypothetical protein
MIQFPYDLGSVPPFPYVELIVRAPGANAPGEVVRLFVDSGSDRTVVPATVAIRQSLDFGNLVRMQGFGPGLVTLREYEAELEFAGLPPIITAVLSAVAGLPAVLGRDVLNQYRITLDGPNHQLEIA